MINRFNLYNYNKSYLEYLDYLLNGNKLDSSFNNHLENLSLRANLVLNMLVSIKEDIVVNLGNLNYKSKVYKYLEDNVINTIGKVVDNNIYVDDKKFENLGDLIAKLRNKTAHGYYDIDINNRLVIFHFEDKSISIRIEKLETFLIYLLMNRLLLNKDDKEYVRCSAVLKNIDHNIKCIDDISMFDDIIRNIQIMDYKLYSLNNKNLEEDVLISLNSYLHDLNGSEYDFKKIKSIKNIFNTEDYKLDISFRNIKKDNKINKLCKYIINKKEYGYFNQVYEFVKEINNYYLNDNKFNLIEAHLSNLFLLKSIYKNNNLDKKNIVSSLKNEYDIHIINYKLYGSSLLTLFYSLFINSYEPYYMNSEFDFSNLDVSLINPEINDITLNTNKNLFDLYNSKLKVLNSKIDNYEKFKQDISKAKNIDVNKIKDLENKYIIGIDSLKIEVNELDNQIKSVMNTYVDYNKYEYNMSIIDGIRNSIVHGNVKIINNYSIDDSEFIFENIYGGNVVFKLQISFKDFKNFIFNNEKVLHEYLINIDDNKNISNSV